MQIIGYSKTKGSKSSYSFIFDKRGKNLFATKEITYDRNTHIIFEKKNPIIRLKFKVNSFMKTASGGCVFLSDIEDKQRSFEVVNDKICDLFAFISKNDIQIVDDYYVGLFECYVKGCFYVRPVTEESIDPESIGDFQWE